MKRTRIIVVNENTLALQKKTNEIEVLRAMATTPITSRFFNYNNIVNFLLYKSDKIRLATPQDFETYRVYFGSFNNTQEYEFQTH